MDSSRAKLPMDAVAAERTLGIAPVEIRRAELSSPDAQYLIGELNAELEARYPEEGTAYHFELSAEQISEGCGAFLIAFDDDEPVGSGAVRRISAVEFEIKRMYVVPTARSRGIGRKVLNCLEEIARGLGATRLVLETGVRQPEALAMYRRAGFAEIALFGEYADTPYPELSVCMAKDL